MIVNPVLPNTLNPHVTSVVQNEPYGQGVPFADFLKDAFAEVTSTDTADKLSGIEALIGGEEDIHNATIAAQKAEITLNLTLQIRNKMIEAYQEVMRMQI